MVRASTRYKRPRDRSRPMLSITASLSARPLAGIVGWLLIAVSVAATLLLQPFWELGAPLWFAAELATAPVEQIDVRPAPFREGRRGRLAVYELRYQFRAADGRMYHGVAWASEGDGTAQLPRDTVEYRPLYPGVSRLAGHRVTPRGPWGLAAFVPGLIGVVLILARRSVTLASARSSGP